MARHQGFEPLGNLHRHAVDRCGHPACDRLADHEHVGVKAPCPRAPARTRTDRVGLVDHQQNTVAPCDLAHPFQVALIGKNDPNVGQSGLHQHTRDVAVGQCSVQRFRIIERDNAGRGRGVEGRPECTGTRHHVSPVVEHRERLVDRPVVAPVHHGDLRAARDCAGETQHETVRIRCRHGELPLGHPEPPSEFVGDPDCVSTRQHRGDPTPRPVVDGFGNSRQRVTGHGPRVAEAQVHVLMAIHIREPRAVRLLEENGEPSRPPCHPRHGHPGQQPRTGLGGKSCGTGMEPAEKFQFLGMAGSEMCAIDLHVLGSSP